MSDDRYELGLDAYASQFHIPREEVWPWFVERVGARFGIEAIHSAALAWTDEVLSLRDRSLVVLAALIAQGGLEGQLRSHARWAIEHGSTREELEEMATLLAIYAGFAKASSALIVIRDELDRADGARPAASS
jgi:4-carboxymuconolactone decarboxylase